MTNLWKEQRQAQEQLVKRLCDALREQSPRGLPLGSASALPYRLSKQIVDDDVEAFLRTFEATAQVAGWPQTEWVIILGPYLTGLAQVLLKLLPLQDLNNYDRVKAAILDRYEIMPETQQQHFCALSFKIGDKLKTLVTELREHTTRWLKPATQGEREIVDKGVLEQVGYAVPPAVRTWLMRVGPTTLEQSAVCLENYDHAEKTNQIGPYPTDHRAKVRPRNLGQEDHPCCIDQSNLASDLAQYEYLP